MRAFSWPAYTAARLDRGLAHFGPAGEGSKLLAPYPVPNQIGDSFYSLTPADLAEMQEVAREALADPDYAV